MFTYKYYPVFNHPILKLLGIFLAIMTCIFTLINYSSLNHHGIPFVTDLLVFPILLLTSLLWKKEIVFYVDEASTDQNCGFDTIRYVSERPFFFRTCAKYNSGITIERRGKYSALLLEGEDTGIMLNEDDTSLLIGLGGHLIHHLEQAKNTA